MRGNRHRINRRFTLPRPVDRSLAPAGCADRRLSLAGVLGIGDTGPDATSHRCAYLAWRRNRPWSRTARPNFGPNKRNATALQACRASVLQKLVPYVRSCSVRAGQIGGVFMHEGVLHTKPDTGSPSRECCLFSLLVQRARAAPRTAPWRSPSRHPRAVHTG